MPTLRYLRAGLLGVAIAGLSGCHLSDVLRVPSPIGYASASTVANQAGAEAVYYGAQSQLYGALYGQQPLIMWSGMLTDEFTFSSYGGNGYMAVVDARRTAEGVYGDPQDSPWAQVLSGRSALLVAVPGLQQYETGASLSKVGEAYALIGYAELFVAESYCGGTPLSQVLPAGGVEFGMPLTDDSILLISQAHFDSALAHAAGNDTTMYLASVGRGRVLLDRGKPDSAAAAVAAVAPTFEYDSQLEVGDYSAGPPYSYNMYDAGFYFGYNIWFTVTDREGGNGLNYISANDPRLQFDSSKTTDDGGRWYLPTKFEVNFATIPMATGVEAQLIRAEAALADNDAATWLADLNALRNSGCTYGADTVCTVGSGQVAGQTAGLPPLADPGSDTGRVSLMFRERAFWLFGIGTRLGDLRRLIRQYQRDQSTVFPTGVFANGNNPGLPQPIPTYGADVNMSLPTMAELVNGYFQETNPHYKACITPTTSA